jgi:hypothetical protein
MKQDTINNLVKKYDYLYGERNEQRKPADIWLSVVKNTSQIAEGLRKSEYWEAKKGLAHTFCWISAFYNKIVKNHKTDFFFESNISFAKVIGFKYPDACGRCGNNICTCGSGNVDLDTEHSLFSPRLLRKRKSCYQNCDDRSLAEFGGMFCELFANSIYRSTIDTLAFHLMEEVGETARCVRHLTEIAIEKQESSLSCSFDSDDLLKPQKNNIIHTQCINLIEEMADTISFMFALSIKLSLIETSLSEEIRHQEISNREEKAQNCLADAITHEYGDSSGYLKCPKCKKNKCICKLYEEDE